MATPPMDPAKVAEARELVARFGTVSAASRASGIPYSTLEKRYKRDPAIQASMSAVKTELVPALAWLKTKPDDEGNAYSVLLKPAQETEPLADRIREALEGMTPAPLVSGPETTLDGLCTVYPLMDMHLGLMAWGKETGDVDYDLDLAASDTRQAKDLGPLRWESLRAFCPPDAYAASMGFGGRRAMQSMTFDKQDGLVLRAFDPVEREPVSFTRG